MAERPVRDATRWEAFVLRHPVVFPLLLVAITLIPNLFRGRVSVFALIVVPLAVGVWWMYRPGGASSRRLRVPEPARSNDDDSSTAP
jgi:hypothetical protein